MATFVLVHGSHDGGWVWQRLAPLLREAGHAVYAPTLTGLADRQHLIDCDVNLTTHVTDIVGLLTFEDLSDVSLVGNSYGGMVITGVAAKVPQRLARLVYLDAYVPDDGQCAADLWPPERRAFSEPVVSGPTRVAAPPSPALFGVSDPTMIAWMTTRMTPHPLATYEEAVSVGNAASLAVPRTFIHCTDTPVSTPDVFSPFAAKARSRGWTVHEIDTGHVPMLTAPQALAAVLLDEVGRAEANE
ncbi:MAG: alpha/beta hydrolase [Trueperaceae bacterium]|nr:alpha/beta hydrolase [Trueperaceae bacterium]